MSKAPAFQFYPADWQRDLSEHPLEIEGAWIRICCAIWWSETPGTATKPLTNWARVLRVGEKKSLSIIQYLLNQNIADVIIQNSTITITSRRMVHDEHIRNIRRCAGSKGGNPAIVGHKKEAGLDKQNLVNQNPTPSSSASFASLESKDLKAQPALSNTPESEPPGTDEEILIDEYKDLSPDKVSDLIVATANDLCRGKFKEAHKWVQRQRNMRINQKAILHTLTRLSLAPDVKNPWGYCDKIISEENGNYHEADYVRYHS